MGFSLFLVETTLFTVLQISCGFCLQSDFIFQLSKVLCFVPEKHMLSATRLWQKRRFRSNGTQKRIWSTFQVTSHKTTQMHECPRKKVPSVANAVVLLSWKRDEGCALGQETGAIVPTECLLCQAPPRLPPTFRGASQPVSLLPFHLWVGANVKEKKQ